MDVKVTLDLSPAPDAALALFAVPLGGFTEQLVAVTAGLARAPSPSIAAPDPESPPAAPTGRSH